MLKSWSYLAFSSEKVQSRETCSICVIPQTIFRVSGIRIENPEIWELGSIFIGQQPIASGTPDLVPATLLVNEEFNWPALQIGQSLKFQAFNRSEKSANLSGMLVGLAVW